MASLWSSSDAAQWQSALDGYWAALEGGGKPKLVELDRLVHVCDAAVSRWFHEELPQDLHESKRQPAHLKQTELVKLVEWKLTRGKTRPNLLKWAREAGPAAVQAASTKAFDVLAPHRGKEAPPAAVKEALAALTVLKGVGPATASAVLEAFDSSIPFSSDEAMLAALQSKDYTVPKVLELTAALRAKAKQLSKSSGRDWTPADVERCLYAASLAAAGSSGGARGAAGSSGGGKATGTKRKR